MTNREQVEELRTALSAACADLERVTREREALARVHVDRLADLEATRASLRLCVDAITNVHCPDCCCDGVSSGQCDPSCQRRMALAAAEGCLR